MAAPSVFYDQIADRDLQKLIDEYAAKRLVATASFFKRKQEPDERYWRHNPHRVQAYQVPRERAYYTLLFYTTRIGEPKDELVEFTREIVGLSPGRPDLKARQVVALMVDVVTHQRINSTPFTNLVSPYEQFQVAEDWRYELKGDEESPGRSSSVISTLVHSERPDEDKAADVQVRAEMTLDLLHAQIPDAPIDFFARDIGFNL